MAELTQIIDEVVRRERGRIVGGLLRLCGTLDAAEEAFQDAALAALEAWRNGIPSNPAAWLTAAAKNRAKDAHRRGAVVAAKQALLVEDDVQELDIDTVTDDMLRLLLVCCHPDLAVENQIALTLKTVCGFSSEEIARAFVTTEATVSQRILRAKRAIEDAGLGYEAPVRAGLETRIAPALGVVYSMFNEGHVGSAGELMRLDLQAEALRLGRLLCDLAPAEPEAFGLVAVIAFAAARAATRVDADGVPILLEAQDRTRWHRELVREGLMALAHARFLGGQGPYLLQAEIAALHVLAPSYTETDWPAVVAFYDALAAVEPSPVVALNRAIALSMRDGPRAGLDALENLARTLADYHLFYAARADMLGRLGKDPRPDLRRALELVTNDSERRLLERRLRG